jgi:hypothetical protein
MEIFRKPLALCTTELPIARLRDGIAHFDISLSNAAKIERGGRNIGLPEAAAAWDGQASEILDEAGL